MNKVILIGRTIKDIELKFTPSNVAVGRFTLAINREYKNKEGNYDSDFINCIAYRQLAETISKYVKKGDKLGIIGRIATSNYKTQDGSTKYITEVVVENIEFLESKKLEVNVEKKEEPKVEDNSAYQEMHDEVALSEDELPF